MTGEITVFDPDLKGPDLLEEMGDRYANDGFHLEAQTVRSIARQWREERGEFAPSEAPSPAKPLVSQPLAPAKAIACELVAGDHPNALPKLQIRDTNLPIGPCWLIPLEPIA